MPRDHVTQSELEAALAALQVPGRFDTAERLVAQIAPGLLRILVEALDAGGWSGADEAREISRALADGGEAGHLRLTGLLAEQTRLAMLVGVAVGIELAGELGLHGGPVLPVTQHGGDAHSKEYE